MNWSEIVKSLQTSEILLTATLQCDEEKVAELIQQSHLENTSILKYNDENSLACVISIAYYTARANYEIIRELPSGEGFADLVFIPRKNCNVPAMIVELKKDKAANIAINQIKRKKYVQGLKSYLGDILL